MPIEQEKLMSFYRGCREIVAKANRENIADFNKNHLPPGRDPLPEHFHDKEWGMNMGRRYARIFQQGNGVFCFVDMESGDVLKAASWAAPAKHARGNINDEHNGLKLIGQYGPVYLR